jgi:hypothetical protein
MSHGPTQLEWKALYEQERTAHADTRRVLSLEVQRLKRLLEQCAEQERCVLRKFKASGERPPDSVIEEWEAEWDRK